MDLASSRSTLVGLTCLSLLLSLLPHASRGAEGEAPAAPATLAAGRDALDALEFKGAIAALTNAAQVLRETDLRDHRRELLETLGLLAAAHLFSGDQAEAKNSLRGLLTLDPTWDYPVSRRTPELAALIETVRAEVSALTRTSVKIRTVPPGALTVIDGLEVGQTPIATEPLLPGRHVVSVSVPGSLTRRETVFVSPGAEVEWLLEPDPTYVAPVPKAMKDERSFMGRHKAALAFGGAALGAGLTTVFALRMHSASVDARETAQIDTAAYTKHAQRATDSALLANIFFYTALGSGALGGAFLVFDRGGPRERAATVTRLRITPTVMPGGGALLVGGTF